jgi:hypothetical protein
LSSAHLCSNSGLFCNLVTIKPSYSLRRKPIIRSMIHLKYLLMYICKPSFFLPRWVHIQHNNSYERRRHPTQLCLSLSDREPRDRICFACSLALPFFFIAAAATNFYRLIPSFLAVMKLASSHSVAAAVCGCGQGQRLGFEAKRRSSKATDC